MISEIHASALRLAHLREAWEAQNAENDAYHLMMVTGDGCDLCKPGARCFWHGHVKQSTKGSI